MTAATASPTNATQLRRIVVGLGCDRQASVDEIEALLRACLGEAGVAITVIACLASIDRKADEPGLPALAAKLDLPLKVFPAVRLEAETPRLANPSAAVFRAIGCHGVAEAAALAVVGADGRLVLPKRRSARVTCALASFPDMADPAGIDHPTGGSPEII